MNEGKNRQASRGSASFVTVDAESEDRRLDNFLLSQLAGLPRSRIYSMIRSGEVRVNKGRARAATRLVAGDQVRIPPLKAPSPGGGPVVAPGKADWLLQHLLYEDEHLLVLNKPGGLAVHGGSGISLGAIELLRAARPDSHYLELVHRLDRDTSGCLLIAKKRSALRSLHEQFREGEVGKHYLALLLGEWKGAEREVDLSLEVTHRENGERHVRPAAKGKTALTRFMPRQIFPGCVLTQVTLLTGRTHQIRVHAAAIGHPVAGDTRYGDGLPGPQKLKRLFLQASRLEIMHPKSGFKLTLNAPLDDELTRVLTGLGFTEWGAAAGTVQLLQ